MRIARPAMLDRLESALHASPSRVPVLLGACGTGRSTLLLDLQQRLGTEQCQYVDLERSATTPERFHRGLCLSSPFVAADVPLAAPTPRAAFDATLAFLTGARLTDGSPATFLLDEVLEFRTFENFPGLRHVLRDLLAAIAGSRNRFVLTTRYVARALRLLRDVAPRFEVLHVPPLAVAELREALVSGSGAFAAADDTAGAVHALTEGHVGHARALLDAMAALGQQGGSDPLSALAAQMEPGATLASRIGWCYELRLHRARGYGALKGILGILAEEEPLTLTEIAQRLQRTPGSTKDYLSWLEDVDLVTVRQKRYSFADPLVRLWARLHCRPMPPSDDEIASEVHQYALARLPQAEPVMAMAGAAPGSGDDDRKTWGIIEID
jgi:hypothetical protein